MPKRKSDNLPKEKRSAQETMEIGIKRLKETYQKNTQGECPPTKVREWEDLYKRQILPDIYGR